MFQFSQNLTWYHLSRAQHSRYAARLSFASRYPSGTQVTQSSSSGRPPLLGSSLRADLLLSGAESLLQPELSMVVPRCWTSV